MLKSYRPTRLLPPPVLSHSLHQAAVNVALVQRSGPRTAQEPEATANKWLIGKAGVREG